MAAPQAVSMIFHKCACSARLSILTPIDYNSLWLNALTSQSLVARNTDRHSRMLLAGIQSCHLRDLRPLDPR
jgi:hypothetical protein